MPRWCGDTLARVLRRLATPTSVVLALAAVAAGGAPAGDASTGASRVERAGDRFATCMRVGTTCGRRVVEGDIPYASFRDRTGARPRVRVCVRDRDGRYCLPRRRPPRGGLLLQPVLYKNTGPQLTTWRVKAKVVGRWRWRVTQEPE
jgi:hypothetical protein